MKHSNNFLGVCNAITSIPNCHLMMMMMKTRCLVLCGSYGADRGVGGCWWYQHEISLLHGSSVSQMSAAAASPILRPHVLCRHHKVRTM